MYSLVLLLFCNLGVVFHAKTLNCTLGFMPDQTGTKCVCPLGYMPDQTGTKCVCLNKISGTVVRCNKDNISILKGHWGYRDSKTSLLDLAVCPLRYCECEEDIHENYLCHFNVNKQCAEKRQGILCSQCEDGLSVRFGNEVCAKCSNKWLALLIPMFAVTLLFVFLIFLTNIDAFSGYLNCFLYCYQVIILIIPENVDMDPFISFVIGITSLQGTGGNFGFCFYDGMTNLQKLPINYILPVMMILWAFFIGRFISKTTWNKIFCRNAAENEREEFNQKLSFGRALSFVLVISYTAFTIPTLKLLRPVTINGKLVLFDAAYAGFFKNTEHRVYGSIAILVLVFIVLLFPTVLLFKSYFLKKWQCINRYRPVLDALSSCYHERGYYRFFVVYYFICRLLLQAVAVFVTVEFSRLILLTVLNVLFQVIFTAFQPYQTKSYNRWDIFLLTDLCIISLLSMILSVPFSTTDNTRTACKYILIVLVYIPFLTVLFRYAVWLYKRYGHKCCCRRADTEDGPGQPRADRGILGRIRRLRNSYRRNATFVPIPIRVTQNQATDL